MKPFAKRTEARCRCGTITPVYIKGSIYENGKIKTAMREAWECGSCGNKEPRIALGAEAIEKVENQTKHIMKKLYDIIETKEIEGQEWSQIAWRGFWEEDSMKALMRSVFNDYPALDGKVAFSYETKKWYVRKDTLNAFDDAIEGFSEYLQPKGGVAEEKMAALDEAFKKQK